MCFRIFLLFSLTLWFQYNFWCTHQKRFMPPYYHSHWHWWVTPNFEVVLKKHLHRWTVKHRTTYWQSLAFHVLDFKSSFELLWNKKRIKLVYCVFFFISIKQNGFYYFMSPQLNFPDHSRGDRRKKTPFTTLASTKRIWRHRHWMGMNESDVENQKEKAWKYYTSIDRLWMVRVCVCEPMYIFVITWAVIAVVVIVVAITVSECTRMCVCVCVCQCVQSSSSFAKFPYF